MLIVEGLDALPPNVWYLNSIESEVPGADVLGNFY